MSIYTRFLCSHWCKELLLYNYALMLWSVFTDTTGGGERNNGEAITAFCGGLTCNETEDDRQEERSMVTPHGTCVYKVNTDTSPLHWHTPGMTVLAPKVAPALYYNQMVHTLFFSVHWDYIHCWTKQWKNLAGTFPNRSFSALFDAYTPGIVLKLAVKLVFTTIYCCAVFGRFTHPHAYTHSTVIDLRPRLDTCTTVRLKVALRFTWGMSPDDYNRSSYNNRSQLH